MAVKILLHRGKDTQAQTGRDIKRGGERGDEQGETGTTSTFDLCLTQTSSQVPIKTQTKRSHALVHFSVDRKIKWVQVR